MTDGGLWLGLATCMLLWQVSANPLWGLGREPRVLRERKPAETHLTVPLHPLRAWLLHPDLFSWRARPHHPFVYVKLSQLVNEEVRKSAALGWGWGEGEPSSPPSHLQIRKLGSGVGEATKLRRGLPQTLAAQPDLATLEFPFCCLVTGSDQLSAQPRPLPSTLSLPVKLGQR